MHGITDQPQTSTRAVEIGPGESRVGWRVAA
jgi:hypothetical protein